MNPILTAQVMRLHHQKAFVASVSAHAISQRSADLERSFRARDGIMEWDERLIQVATAAINERFPAGPR